MLLTVLFLNGTVSNNLWMCEQYMRKFVPIENLFVKCLVLDHIGSQLLLVQES